MKILYQDFANGHNSHSKGSSQNQTCTVGQTVCYFFANHIQSIHQREALMYTVQLDKTFATFLQIISISNSKLNEVNISLEIGAFLREGIAKYLFLSQVPLVIIYGGKIVETARSDLKMVQNRSFLGKVQSPRATKPSRAGLDLTCSLFKGLNLDNVLFFYQSQPCLKIDKKLSFSK